MSSSGADDIGQCPEVRRWLTGSGYDERPAERAGVLDSLRGFCEFAGQTPGELIAACLRSTSEGMAISGKGRRSMQAAIDEYVARPRWPRRDRCRQSRAGLPDPQRRVHPGSGVDLVRLRPVPRAARTALASLLPHHLGRGTNRRCSRIRAAKRTVAGSPYRSAVQSSRCASRIRWPPWRLVGSSPLAGPAAGRLASREMPADPTEPALPEHVMIWPEGQQ